MNATQDQAGRGMSGSMAEPLGVSPMSYPCLRHHRVGTFCRTVFAAAAAMNRATPSPNDDAPTLSELISSLSPAYRHLISPGTGVNSLHGSVLPKNLLKNRGKVDMDANRRHSVTQIGGCISGFQRLIPSRGRARRRPRSLKTGAREESW